MIFIGALKNFNEPIKYNKKVKYLSEWSKLGLHQTNGKMLPKVDIKAKLLVIDKSNKNLLYILINRYLFLQELFCPL